MSDEKVTTQTILEKARELGQLIARHPASSAYNDALDKLENDRDAQRLLTDYNRQLQAMGEKEAAGQPIEVEEKRRIRDLQAQVAMNPALSRLQMTQMDYLDLMRKVESAMSEEASSPPASSSPS